VTANAEQKPQFLKVLAKGEEDKGWCAYREGVLSLTHQYASQGYVATLRGFVDPGRCISYIATNGAACWA